MQYLSVKDISVKFKLSERRVQQLCDAGRIEGVQRISGVGLFLKMRKSLLMIV